MKVETPLLQQLTLRDQLHRAIRSFFHDRGYLEVHTPIRVKTPAMEAHIDALPSDGMFLRTSPEAHMKRLLCNGIHRQFQLGPCFRKDEQGDLHHPEFTLLEWYRAPAGYLELMEETQALLMHCQKNIPLGRAGPLDPPCSSNKTSLPTGGSRGPALPKTEWPVRSVEDLFRAHCDWNPFEAFDAERFNLSWIDQIEPALPEGPVFVTDFPIQLAAMSRPHPKDPRKAERWELYWRGLELANAYGEFMDQEGMRNRFEEWAQERASRGQPVYEMDEAFIRALASPPPPAAGIALGVERLMMALAGASSLDEVYPFRDG